MDRKQILSETLNKLDPNRIIVKDLKREEVIEALIERDIDNWNDQDTAHACRYGTDGYESYEDKELKDVYINVFEDSYCDDCAKMIECKDTPNFECWVNPDEQKD